MMIKENIVKTADGDTVKQIKDMLSQFKVVGTFDVNYSSTTEDTSYKLLRSMGVLAEKIVEES